MDSKKPNPLDADKIETHPDGWERFRSAVHAAAKSGPKHRTKVREPDPSVVKDEGKR